MTDDRKQMTDVGNPIACLVHSCNTLDPPAPSIEQCLTLCPFCLQHVTRHPSSAVYSLSSVFTLCPKRYALCFSIRYSSFVPPSAFRIPNSFLFRLLHSPFRILYNPLFFETGERFIGIAELSAINFLIVLSETGRKRKPAI